MSHNSSFDIGDCKSVALFSNYSWAYTSANVVKKYFPHSRITLITKNTSGLAKMHNFGIDVIEVRDVKSKGRSFFKKLSPDAIVIDYGFSFDIALSVLIRKFKKIFIIDLGSPDILRPIKKSEFLKIFMKKMPYFINSVLIYGSKRFKTSVGLGLPSELSIETTSVCNLKCMACPTGLGRLNRPPMPMPRELFKAIIENNRANFKYFNVIYPFLLGEPLLSKDIFEHIENLRSISHPYTRIELHTNGNIKNSRSIARRLLKTGIDLISISVDGTDKVAYESFRRGGDFELVCEFIKNLAIAKKELGLIRPEIVMQMILTKYSEEQINEFKSLRDELGADRFAFKDFFYEFAGLSDEEGYSMVPLKKELFITKEEKQEIINKKNNLCGWAYRAISIMANGNVVPCCVDFNASLLNGLNIYGSTIKKIWNSSQYRRFRSDMLKGKVQMCNRCFLS